LKPGLKLLPGNIDHAGRTSISGRENDMLEEPGYRRTSISGRKKSTDNLPAQKLFPAEGWQIAWKLVPLRHFFPLKVAPLIEVLLYRRKPLKVAHSA
jgi:hypothetical protein